jgi:hypothetical protein
VWLYRVEKYRPILLDDIVGNSETVDRLKVIARDGNCPHIVLSVCIRPTYEHDVPSSNDIATAHMVCRALQVLVKRPQFYVWHAHYLATHTKKQY